MCFVLVVICTSIYYGRNKDKLPILSPIHVYLATQIAILAFSELRFFNTGSCMEIDNLLQTTLLYSELKIKESAALVAQSCYLKEIITFILYPIYGSFTMEVELLMRQSQVL